MTHHVPTLSPLTDLHPHPAQPAPDGLRLQAGFAWGTGDTLTLHYRLQAASGAVVWPAPAIAGAADGLWQATCFEAFVSAGGPAYHEFNWSPAGQWAFYRFACERVRSPDSTGPDTAGFNPRIQAGHEAGRAWLQADLPRSALPHADSHGWQLGLNAVLQAPDGRLSYWALRHPLAERPDFHHPDGRALRLPRP